MRDDRHLREELLNEFVAEALEHLDAAEELLLAAESTGPDGDSLTRVMRAMHSIKGSASYLGLESIQQLAHVAESAVQRLGGSSDIAIVSLLLQAVRELRQMVEHADQDTEATETLLTTLKSVAGPEGTNSVTSGRSSKSSIEKVFCDVASQQCQALRVAAERLAVDPQDTTAQDIIRRAVSSLARAAKYTGVLDLLGMLEPVMFDNGIDSEGAWALAASVEDFLAGLGQAGQQPPRAPESVVSQSSPPGKQTDTTAIRTLRVPQDRVDHLIDSVAELITVRNQVQHFLSRLDSRGCEAAICREAKLLSFYLGKAIDDVQNTAVRLRLIRLETVFRPLARVARDVAERTGKRVNLELIGSEIEVDKAIAEAIVDPLLHLVRNAVDHGIETGAERSAIGKPPQGLVQVAGRREGSNIVIAVADDGRGIDLDAVLAKATALGVLSSSQAPALSPDDLYSLLFQPGFTTARAVTEVSGRGVGLDVVKANVDRLGGSVSVQSVRGEGTRIELMLPVRLAAQNVLLVEVGGQMIGVPLHTVRESLSIQPDQIDRVAGGPAIVNRGKVISLISMAKTLGLPDGHRGELSHALIVKVGREQEMGLIVEAIGQHYQVVVKPLTGVLATAGVLGAAMLANGQLVPVVDPVALVQISTACAHERRASGTYSPEAQQTASLTSVDGRRQEVK